MTSPDVTEEVVAAPLLTISGGVLDDDEVAAVTALLTASAAAPEPEKTDLPLAGGWKSYYRTLRAPHRPGPGAWRNTVY